MARSRLTKLSSEAPVPKGPALELSEYKRAAIPPGSLMVRAKLVERDSMVDPGGRRAETGGLCGQGLLKYPGCACGVGESARGEGNGGSAMALIGLERM